MGQLNDAIYLKQNEINNVYQRNEELQQKINSIIYDFMNKTILLKQDHAQTLKELNRI